MSREITTKVGAGDLVQIASTEPGLVSREIKWDAKAKRCAVPLLQRSPAW